MKSIIHRNEERGFADHGWLKAFHSFSFSNWDNPDKVQFGKLRVLNDDIILPGEGFGKHPHENMEIVTIPLEGILTHKDSMGNEEIIEPNEVQVMSAGTGIYHSEYNASDKNHLNLLQIWIFPDKNGHTPRYNQIKFDADKWKNKIYTIVAPIESKKSLWLNQNAYISRCNLHENRSVDFNMNDKSNGVYIFVISGNIIINEKVLSRRDAMGLWETEAVNITTNEYSELLFIEVSME